MVQFIFSHIAFFILNVMHKSCPEHHQKVTLPKTPSPLKNDSQQFFDICLPFYWASIAFSVAFFCMHICRKSLARLMFKCQWEGKNILLEYFWFVFSVLSVRIILDTAYSRNMGGSWARDWENHFRVSSKVCI